MTTQEVCSQTPTEASGFKTTKELSHRHLAISTLIPLGDRGVDAIAQLLHLGMEVQIENLHASRPSLIILNTLTHTTVLELKLLLV